MKKSNLIHLRIFFVFSALITSAIVVGILFSSADKKLEIITGLFSVTVTLILGVITYYQTREQTQIDMIDKTPYFRIVKDTQYEQHANQKDIDINTLYRYTKFLQYENLGTDIGAVVKIEVENVSDCIIKRVKKYICADQKLSCGGKVVPYSETALVHRLGHPDSVGYDYRNNFNLHEKEFDLIAGDSFETAVMVDSWIDTQSAKQYDFTIAFEIETVHGYEYTQYMEFSIQPVPVDTAANWITITDYDVTISQGKIPRKYLCR
ncbi:MAG: hypothetical protein IIV99_04925 [Oscillospiraceae bacterium]|nr:hypothetical protein [Oscillospiraceae bacterium]